MAVGIPLGIIAAYTRGRWPDNTIRVVTVLINTVPDWWLGLLLLIILGGYLGVVPPAFTTEWTLRSKVLAIVDDNATAIDARLPEGGMTLAKLHPSLNKLTITEGDLSGYAQFANSDCLNGAVLKVPDGRHMLNTLSSHHYLLMAGHHLADIQMVCQLFGIEIEQL